MSPGDMSLPETLPTHCRHRRVPPRCPRSRPSAGGSCSARGCWGAGRAPPCHPARPRGRCPSAPSWREAGSPLSSTEGAGSWGQQWRVPASLGSWGWEGVMQAAPMAHPLAVGHPASPNTPPAHPPCSPHPHHLFPHPCSPSMPQIPPDRADSPCPRIPPCPGARAGTLSRTLCRGAGAQECAWWVTPCWPPSPRSHCPSPVTQCAAPADASGRAGLVLSTPFPSGVWGCWWMGTRSHRGLTLRGRCWAALLPTPLLRRDRGARDDSGSPRGSLATAGGSSVVAGDRWPRVPPGHGSSSGGSGPAFLSGGCLWGEDGA